MYLQKGSAVSKGQCGKPPSFQCSEKDARMSIVFFSVWFFSHPLLSIQCAPILKRPVELSPGRQPTPFCMVSCSVIL